MSALADMEMWIAHRSMTGEGDMPDRLSELIATVRASLVKMAAPEHDVDVEAEFVAFAEQWLAALCDDNDDLRALLREYGRHQEGCSAQFNEPIGTAPIIRPPYRCRCGWDEAEKTLEGK